MSFSGKSPGCFAAIDFGTANCSLAYTINGKVSNLHLSEGYTRVPTAVLLKRTARTSSTVEVSPDFAFGHIAQQRYQELLISDYSSHLYFECFKMNLRNEQEISRSMQISSGFENESFYLIEIISVVLQCLKSCFEKKLTLLGGQLKVTDFRWVITVPAIWQDKGKQMMKEAAYKAGLLCEVAPITELTPVTKPLDDPVDPSKIADKLILALEPECAALYCRQLKNDELASYCGSPDDIVAQQYMVVDIGGGTVDIAVHDYDSTTNTIHSVLPPTGNDCGGTKVNEEFARLLQKIVGDVNFEQFCSTRSRTRQKVILNTIFQKFENAKQDFGSNGQDSINIRLDMHFVDFYGEQKIIAGIQTLGDDRVVYHGDDDSVLSIASSKMEDFFAPALQGIINCMRSALEKSSIQITTLYLVGGFGGCQYIYKNINDEVSRKYPKIKIIVPADHKITISRGALIFQQNPSIIFSRVCGAYYGIEISEDWVAEKHDISRAEHNKKLKRVQCHHVFDTFLQKGQTVTSKDIFQKLYEPTELDSNWVTLNIYCTYQDGIKYTKDERHNPIPGVKKIGELKLETPHTQDLPKGEHIQRTVSVTFYIDRTDIQVRALYVPTQKKISTNLDFLSSC